MRETVRGATFVTVAMRLSILFITIFRHSTIAGETRTCRWQILWKQTESLVLHHMALHLGGSPLHDILAAEGELASRQDGLAPPPVSPSPVPGTGRRGAGALREHGVAGMQEF